MKIEWTITKKRGNWRPILKYTITKEQWEADLVVPGGSVETPWPRSYSKNPGCRIYYTSQSNGKILPGECERGKAEEWPVSAFQTITIPGSDNLISEDSLYLPWKPGANPEYPEVAEVFQAVQNEYERRLKEAYDSGPFEVSGSLEMSSECKRYIAPGIAKEKMLKVVGE